MDKKSLFWQYGHTPVKPPPETSFSGLCACIILKRRSRSDSKEIKRRTCVATLFTGEESLLRLVSAVLAEPDEEWATAKNYLPKETK